MRPARGCEFQNMTDTPQPGGKTGWFMVMVKSKSKNENENNNNDDENRSKKEKKCVRG